MKDLISSLSIKTSIRAVSYCSLIFVCSFFISCHKDNNTITSSYMSFNVNGTPNNVTYGIDFFKVDGFTYGTDNDSSGYIDCLFRVQSSKSFLGMYIYAQPKLGEKIYLINDSSRSGYLVSGITDIHYNFDTTKSYIIFTRRDSVISGTFECHGTNDTGGVVNITNGQFAILPH